MSKKRLPTIGPPPGGQPPPNGRRFTKPQQAVFFKAVENGVTAPAAATVAGTTYSTVWRWLTKSPRFRQRFEEAEKVAISRAETKLAKLAIVDENLAALKYYLNNRAPDRWKSERRLKLEGSIGLIAPELRDSLREMPEDLLRANCEFALKRQKDAQLPAHEDDAVEGQVVSEGEDDRERKHGTTMS